MKTLAILTFLVMFLVSCGGGTDSSTTNSTATKGNTTAFEAPPTPGVNK
jgi:PBP1b-binding outer membrane lipoprotein LpoB